MATTDSSSLTFRGDGGKGTNAVHRNMNKSKVIVRNIPVSFTKEEFIKLIEEKGFNANCFCYYVPGKLRSGNRASIPSCAYMTFKKYAEKTEEFIHAFQGYTIEGNNGIPDSVPLQAEYSICQKVPRGRARRDVKAGTIDRDPDYIEFLSVLSSPPEKLPSAEAQLDGKENEPTEYPIAPVLQYVIEQRAKRAHARSKGGRGKQATVVLTRDSKTKSAKRLEKDAKKKLSRRERNKLKSKLAKESSREQKTSTTTSTTDGNHENSKVALGGGGENLTSTTSSTTSSTTTSTTSTTSTTTSTTPTPGRSKSNTKTQSSNTTNNTQENNSIEDVDRRKEKGKTKEREKRPALQIFRPRAARQSNSSKTTTSNALEPGTIRIMTGKNTETTTTTTTTTTTLLAPKSEINGGDSSLEMGVINEPKSQSTGNNSRFGEKNNSKNRSRRWGRDMGRNGKKVYAPKPQGRQTKNMKKQFVEFMEKKLDNNKETNNKDDQENGY